MSKLEYHTYGEFYDRFVFENDTYKIAFRKDSLSIFEKSNLSTNYVNSVKRLFGMPFCKDILNLFVEIEKLEKFELIHIDAAPENADLGNVLCRNFGSNEYYEKYNAAIPFFYKVKKFISEILDLYSELYE